MILLTSATDILRVVTGAAADVDVYVAYVDAPIPATPTSNVTPGKQIVAGIITAATTTVCAAPTASTARNIKTLSIENTHASASTVVGVEFFDGTSVIELAKVTLLAGESLQMDELGHWEHYDSQHGEYGYSPAPSQNLGVTGTIAETMPREICPEVNTTVATSGTLFMQAIKLRAGDLVSTIDLWSATTAAGTPTNYNAGLYNVNRNLLAQGTNKTTEAWAANSQKSFAMTTPYRVPVTGTYYIGYYMAATAVVTLKGGTAKVGGQLAGGVPILHGTSSTGLTTALPNPAGVISVSTASIFAAVR